MRLLRVILRHTLGSLAILLCLLIVAFWIRSHYVADDWLCRGEEFACMFRSSAGGLQLSVFRGRSVDAVLAFIYEGFYHSTSSAPLYYPRINAFSSEAISSRWLSETGIGIATSGKNGNGDFNCRVGFPTKRGRAEVTN